jgi:hypothetical protein
MVSRKPGSEHSLGFLHALLDDITPSNQQKDLKLDKITLTKRFEKEGLSFLTKTLPKLGKALDAALETGKFMCPTNFRRHKNSAFPCFTRVLLLRIFDVNGFIKDSSLINYSDITELRQLYYAFYKYIVDFTEEQQCLAEQKFSEVDKKLTPLTFAHQQMPVLMLAKSIITNLFRDFDPYDIVPFHGPGITSSGEKPHEKRFFSTKYRSIHNEYPYYRYFYINHHHLLDCVDDYRSRNQLDYGINKVLFVPKDSRGPRTIACEPLEYMFLQQGLRSALYNFIENHPFTRGRINFTDQSINQEAARKSSFNKDGTMTVDLKDASDSVSVYLVDYLFKDTKLHKPLMALRTPVSKLPSGKQEILNKYAAMGSSLCFVIEALVFFTLSLSVARIFGHSDSVIYVYGDDLILNTSCYSDLERIFSYVGLQINSDKTFRQGFFRESCGAEFYNGSDVTYLKVRRLGTSTTDDTVSSVELANQLWSRCYYKAAEYVRDLLPNSIPFGSKDSPYLCFYDERHPLPSSKTKRRWNPRFHRYDVRRPVVTGISYHASVDSDAEKYAEYYRKVTQGWSPYYRSGNYTKRGCKIKYTYVDSSL